MRRESAPQPTYRTVLTVSAYPTTHASGSCCDPLQDPYMAEEWNSTWIRQRFWKHKGDLKSLWRSGSPLCDRSRLITASVGLSRPVRPLERHFVYIQLAGRKHVLQGRV